MYKRINDKLIKAVKTDLFNLPLILLCMLRFYQKVQKGKFKVETKLESFILYIKIEAAII